MATSEDAALVAFARYCKRENITSEQYQAEIWPVFQAAYCIGAAAVAQRCIKKLIDKMTPSKENND